MGVRILFFSQNFYYFFLGAHAKFGNPTTTLSGRTVMAVEKKKRKEEKFPLAPMGVLAPGSAHADPPLGPPSTLAEIFRHTCLQSKLQKEVYQTFIYISYKPMHKFETLGQTLIGF